MTLQKGHSMTDAELMQVVEREKLRQEEVRLKAESEGSIFDRILGRWITWDGTTATER